MPTAHRTASGGGPGAWGGLRSRIALLTMALFLALALIQGLALLLLHPDLTGPQLAGLAALTVALALIGGAAATRLTGALLRPLWRVQQVVSVLVSGQAPSPPDGSRGAGGLEALADGLERLAPALRLRLDDLGASATRLKESSHGLREGLARHGAAAAIRAEALRQATTAAAAIAGVTQEAAREADSVIGMTLRAESLAVDGLEAVDQALRSAGALGDQVRRIAATMGELSERALQVGEIVASVKDLAEQSNLLALNASIEAAKAGEHGRGFSAVAMEMRNLAEQSRQAAVQVRSILGEIQRHAREAALATQEGSSRADVAMGRSRSAGEAIEGLASVIRESAGSAQAIADRTRTQAAGAANLVEAIAALTAAAQQGAMDSAVLEARAAEIAALAIRLGAPTDPT